VPLFSQSVEVITYIIDIGQVPLTKYRFIGHQASHPIEHLNTANTVPKPRQCRATAYAPINATPLRGAAKWPALTGATGAHA
jgi:hypothetical protein